MPKSYTCGVYRITSPSGRFYIGSSLSVEKRWRGHRSALRRGDHHCPPLQRAAEKYGVDALKFDVLAECPADDLRELEQLVIDMADPAYNASRSTFEALSGLWKNPEFRVNGVKRSREQLRQRWLDPEFRRRQAKGSAMALSQTHKDPNFAAAHKVRAIARLAEIVNTPEGKLKAAEGRRKRYANDPEAADRRRQCGREAMAALHANAALAERLREQARLRMTAARANPAARAKNLASVLAAHEKPVRCVETGQEFASVEAAARWAGLSGGSGISSVLNGRRTKAGGYSWARAAKTAQGT